MLKRFDRQKAVFLDGLSCLGYSIAAEDNYSAILSNGTNWDFELAGDPRDDFFLISLIDRKGKKKYYISTLMKIFLWQDPGEGILYCSIGIRKLNIDEYTILQLNFILENKRDLFDGLVEYDIKYKKYNVAPWWACLNGTPPDLSYLYSAKRIK